MKTERYNELRGYAKQIEEEIHNHAIETFGTENEKYYWCTELNSFDHFFVVRFTAMPASKTIDILRRNGIEHNSVIIDRTLNERFKSSVEELTSGFIADIDRAMPGFIEQVEILDAKAKALLEEERKEEEQ